jgi:translation initiation factor 1A
MPNFKGGKGFKKKKKHSGGFREKQLILRNPDDDQEYAQVKKVNGSGRYQLSCFDGQDRLGISAGNIRKRYRIHVGDIVLISRWVDIQDSKCSIVHKYDDDEARKLQDQGEFPETVTLEQANPFETPLSNDDLFGFPDQKPMEIPDSSSEEEEEEEEINLDDI